MSDNSSPFFAKDYDEQIHKTIPFYDYIHASALDLVKTVLPQPRSWLDTGCGTGSFALKAAAVLPDTFFYLADPSVEMLKIVGDRCEQPIARPSAELDFPDESFDVITAILSHHYLNEDGRQRATKNCFRMLKKGGLYVTFENIRPLSAESLPDFLRRWQTYKGTNGGNADERELYERFDTEYFPITVTDHINLLRQTGFTGAEVFWLTYMQAGFYARKV